MHDDAIKAIEEKLKAKEKELKWWDCAIINRMFTFMVKLRRIELW
jgi:hypothetical protein